MVAWRSGAIVATPAKRARKASPTAPPAIRSLLPTPANHAGSGVAPKPLVPPGSGRVPGVKPSPWNPTPGYVFPDGTVQPPNIAGPKDPTTDLSWQDSEFNTTVANLLSQRDQGKSAIVAASRRAAEDRDRNIGLIGEGRGKAKTAATQSANKSGLFYSGTLGKNLGDVDTDYNRRVADTNTSYTRGEQDRAEQDRGLGTAYDQAWLAAAQQAQSRWQGAAQGTEAPTTPSLAALIAALNASNTKTKTRSR